MKKKIIRITKRIFFLPPVPTLLIAIPSFAFLLAVLTGRIIAPALQYIAYILSAYALAISVTGTLKIVEFAKKGVREHPFMKWLLLVPIVEKLIHENQFRTEIALYPGFCINVLYVIFKTATGIYSIITAVMNLVKYRKYGSPILSAAKVINMSTALVSIFSLETAMLAQFGSENTEHFRVIMTAFTGAGVSFIVVGMAVYMIVRAGALIKRNTEGGK